MNVVRTCVYYTKSEFAHNHENSRCQILEMLVWAWHLEVDLMVGDGDCATYRYFPKQDTPNWNKSDLCVWTKWSGHAAIQSMTKRATGHRKWV